VLIIDKIEVELGKVKGLIEELKVEISREKIERLSQRRILVDLKSSLERIRYFLLKETKTYIGRLRTANLLEALLLVRVSPKIEQGVDSYFTSLISSVDYAIYQLDAPSYYKDEDIRRGITNLIFSLDSFITRLTDALSLPPTGIAQIEELISIKSVGLNERWAVANCYLSAMEIVVNRKLKKEGIKTNEKDFASKFKALLKVLESKGVKVSELERELPPAFWKLRNQVVHVGYSPTQEELDLITTWVKKIIKLVTG